MVSTLSSGESASTLFDLPGAGAGEPVTSDSLSRGQVIERIMALNPTAGVEFLQGFTERALRTYLDHLVATQIPRGRLARWVRPGDTPGIVMAEPRD